MAFLDETGLAELWSLITAEDDSLADRIANLSAERARFETGSYSGSGSRTNTRTFSFAPQIVFITRENSGAASSDSGWSSMGGIYLFRTQSGAKLYIDGVSKTTVTFSGNTLTLTTDSSYSADMSYNASGDTYNYWAFG